MRRFIRKFRKSFRYGQKGFTLIELLVVVAILGVLAAVAIPAVARFIGEGAEEAKETEYANVLVAVTAAMVEGAIGTCTAIPAAAQIIANPGGPPDDVGTYLINNTEYWYTVDGVTGDTQQFDPP